VIGRRDAKRSRDQIDLDGANLTGAYLPGANLAVDLGGANLTEAVLVDANLDGAYLFRAILVDANLHSARLRRADLEGANLTGARWPRDAAVPEGWKLDTGSGRLKRAGTGSGPTGAN